MIQRRLNIRMMLIIGGVVLTIASSMVSILFNIDVTKDNYLKTAEHRLQTFSTVVGDNCATALWIEQYSEIDEYLNSLTDLKEVDLIQITDTNNNVVSEEYFTESELPYSITDITGFMQEGKHLYVVKPIMDDIGMVGKIFMVGNTRELDANLNDYYISITWISLLTLLVMVLLVLYFQRFISNPIIRLT